MGLYNRAFIEGRDFPESTVLGLLDFLCGGQALGLGFRPPSTSRSTRSIVCQLRFLWFRIVEEGARSSW